MVASLGVRYALNNKQGLSLSVGYAAEKLEFETFERFNGRYDMSYTRKPATYVEGELFASYTIISATSTVSEMKMSIGDEAIWVKCKKQ